MKLNRLTNFVRGTLSDTEGDGYMDTSSGSSPKTWTLDAVGNWTNVTGETGNRTNNAQNEATQVNGNTLSYDADGNIITSQSGAYFTYDAWNHQTLAMVTIGNINLYANDALGRRIATTHGGTTTDLYYSNQWQVIDEYRGGNLHSRYVWNPSYPNAMIFRQQDTNGNGEFDPEEQLWVTYDANYNVTSLIGVDGTEERFTYDPYGSRTVLTSSWTSTTDGDNWIYGFQGGRLDPNTGLYNFQHRDYDPNLGRWIEQDPNPAGQYNDGMNLYQFVQSNPVDRVDPTGLDEAATGYGVSSLTPPAGGWFGPGGGGGFNGPAAGSGWSGYVRGKGYPVWYAPQDTSDGIGGGPYGSGGAVPPGWDIETWPDGPYANPPLGGGGPGPGYTPGYVSPKPSSSTFRNCQCAFDIFLASAALTTANIDIAVAVATVFGPDEATAGGSKVAEGLALAGSLYTAGQSLNEAITNCAGDPEELSKARELGHDLKEANDKWQELKEAIEKAIELAGRS